jgi:hypothetical protein
LIASYQSHSALSKQAESYLLQIATQKSNEYEQIFNRIKEELKGMGRGFFADEKQRREFFFYIMEAEQVNQFIVSVFRHKRITKLSCIELFDVKKS